MPCIKCSNKKWRYGSGNCIYPTKKKCEEAAAAIHANEDKKRKRHCLGCIIGRLFDTVSRLFKTG